MADIEQLIKDGLKGAIAAPLLDIAFNAGIPIQTAAEIGAFTAGAIEVLKDNESKSQARPPQKHEYKDTTNDELIRFDARNISQSNSSYGNAGGGGMNRVHVFHHDAEKDETHAPFPQGDGREDFAFSEGSNYAERLEYEPFAGTSESCRTESCNSANCAITARKLKKEVPAEVQQSILKYQGKSPSRACEKHGVEMPTNSCYSCNGGQKCEHLSIYDGTHKKAHCTYSQSQPLPMPRDDKTVNVRRGWNPISLRHVNRARLTGIERNNLLALADDTFVDDKDSLRQELTDHIDNSLTYGENKTALQDYLASVTPLNTDVTEREIKDYEAHINAIEPIEVEQANDPFLMESLRERAAQGDSSAGMQLELMQIKRDGFEEMDALAPEAPPMFESAPIPTFESTPSPMFESAPDPAMSWCSSTPETIKFSESFAPPIETFNPAETWGAPTQASAIPQMQNKTII